MFDVLESHTEYQKRGMEELSLAPRFDRGTATAAAALKKPEDKPKEQGLSMMTEVQIMEKLRQVVSRDDPMQLYSKIKMIGQGYVRELAQFGWVLTVFNALEHLGIYMWPRRWRLGKRL